MAPLTDYFNAYVRLPVHELDEILARASLRLVQEQAIDVVVERDFANLIGVEGEVMAHIEGGEIQSEMRSGALAAAGVPTVGEKDAADVEKQSNRFFQSH